MPLIIGISRTTPPTIRNGVQTVERSAPRASPSCAVSSTAKTALTKSKRPSTSNRKLLNKRNKSPKGPRSAPVSASAKRILSMALPRRPFSSRTLMSVSAGRSGSGANG